MDGLELLGSFDSVLDVGGNRGRFAEQARRLWPAARITSFEPIPAEAKLNRRLAENRWHVEQVAISDQAGEAVLHYCVNQPSASTMQKPGSYRQERLGINDRFEEHTVRTQVLDFYVNGVGGAGAIVPGRLLVKVDVEGHELQVIAGARNTLAMAAAVIVECQQDPEIFLGAPQPGNVDRILRMSGLGFAGVLASFAPPDGKGRVVQFDGLWIRAGRGLRP